MLKAQEKTYHFTKADRQFLKGFSLEALPPLPPAKDNGVADNISAAKLGHRLFFDKSLSANASVSCASCHNPEKYFTDGLKRSEALGTTRRNAPTIMSAPWSPWLFWDGRKDSLWAQALSPLENSHEQGISRLEIASIISEDYGDEYEEVFGSIDPSSFFKNLPRPATPLGNELARKNWQSIPKEAQEKINRIFVNVGKAIMAYQRRLQLPPAPFDRFVSALAKTPEAKINSKAESQALATILREPEVKGLRLFMGQANCASCHNGPWFTNFEFHNIGAPEPVTSHVDLGRFEGVTSLEKDEFTCLSQWSDASLADCEEMRFLKRIGPELVGAFKTPSLRNVAKTAPYMQSGQFSSLAEVVAHYNKPKPPFYDPTQQPNRPHFDILPLRLEPEQLAQLVAFLGTLTSPIPSEEPWWHEPEVDNLRVSEK